MCLVYFRDNRDYISLFHLTLVELLIWEDCAISLLVVIQMLVILCWKYLLHSLIQWKVRTTLIYLPDFCCCCFCCYFHFSTQMPAVPRSIHPDCIYHILFSMKLSGSRFMQICRCKFETSGTCKNLEISPRGIFRH